MGRRRGLATGGLLLSAVVAVMTLLLLINVRGGGPRGGRARLVELHTAALRLKERLVLDAASAIRLPGRSPVTIDHEEQRLIMLVWKRVGDDGVLNLPAEAVVYQAIPSAAGGGNCYLLRDGVPLSPYPLSSLRFSSTIRGRERVLTISARLLEHDVRTSSAVVSIPLRFELSFPRPPARRGYQEFVRYDD